MNPSPLNGAQSMVLRSDAMQMMREAAAGETTIGVASFLGIAVSDMEVAWVCKYCGYYGPTQCIDGHGSRRVLIATAPQSALQGRTTSRALA